MSAVLRRPGINRRCKRNRSPRRWISERIDVSAGVSRWGVARICLRAASDEAFGMLALKTFDHNKPA